ncbi:hypothetical protein LguiA_017998 [Lonicera macranthoides]
MSWVEVVEQVQVHLRVFSDAPMELVVKEGPSNLNGDEQPMKIGYLTPIKCIDHNVDCGDELVNLNADGGDGSDEGVKVENIIDLNFEGSDGVNIENFIDLNFDGGSDERVNIKPSSQTKSFDLNSDSGTHSDLLSRVQEPNSAM